MKRFFACVAAIGFILTGCTDGANTPTEPVANDQSAPSIPDSPGESGESAEKPAGAGEAGAKELPATEKSQPNLDAANRSASTAPGTVNSGALNVRSGPGMKFDVIKVLQKGEAVTATDCGVVWCKIGEGQYVSKKFLN
jgi:hypothetical protein